MYAMPLRLPSSMLSVIETNWSLSKVTRDAFVWDAPMSTAPVCFKINDKERLCYFEGTQTAGPHDRVSENSLTTSPLTLDINVAHGLLGHPDTCTVKACVEGGIHLYHSDRSISKSQKECLHPKTCHFPTANANL
jgi:hypothetical protein